LHASKVNKSYYRITFYFSHKDAGNTFSPVISEGTLCGQRYSINEIALGLGLLALILRSRIGAALPAEVGTLVLLMIVAHAHKNHQ